MGLSIGTSARAISAPPPSARLRPEGTPVPAGRGPDDAVTLVPRPELPEIRAGFGENTLSPSGAALTTVNSNLEAAERLIPTVEELRERARVNRAERAEAAAASRETGRTEDLRRRELVRPAPDPAVRNFAPEPRPVSAPEAVERPTFNPASPAAPGGLESSVANAPTDPARTRLDIRI